jgi:hypothetical protein
MMHATGPRRPDQPGGDRCRSHRSYPARGRTGSLDRSGTHASAATAPIGLYGTTLHCLATRPDVLLHAAVARRSIGACSGEAAGLSVAVHCLRRSSISMWMGPSNATGSRSLPPRWWIRAAARSPLHWASPLCTCPPRHHLLWTMMAGLVRDTYGLTEIPLRVRVEIMGSFMIRK